MKYQWSEKVLKKMENYKTLMFEAERWLWAHPQTGFKEWAAHTYLKEKFESMGFRVTEVGDIPGFYFDIDTGKEGPTFAILGELDALLVAAHPEADKETGAVHACGHHCQVSALLGVAGVLQDGEILSELCGKIRIVAVPAEELIELGDRAAMKAEGKLKYFSGKSEFMRRGVFDGVDLAMMIHTNHGEKPGMYVGPGTTGIVAKRIVFHGSKNRGGASPDGAVNALQAAQTAFGAINALRETFPDRYRIRHHAIITEGGKSVVHIPSDVVVEAHVRATDFKVLKETNEKINRAYTAVAMAFGAQVTIDDLEVYIPENDLENPDFMRLVYEVGSDLLGEENVVLDFNGEGRSAGGTDMGNLGAVMPVVQPYSTGQIGWAHQPNFQIKYPEYAVFHPACVQAATACALLEKGGDRARKIVAEHKPLFSSIGEYFKEMDKMYFLKKGVEYHDDGTATASWK